jgi:hypothetical protein
VKGRVREPCRLGDLPEDVQPGDIWRYLNGDGTPISAKEMYSNTPAVKGNLTDTVWGYMSPNGAGIGTLAIHTVREHEDGTVSVRPGDGSSNSIMHNRGEPTQWHGYIEHNEWRAV